MNPTQRRVDVYVRTRNVLRAGMRTFQVGDEITLDYQTDHHGVERLAGVEVLGARGVEVDGLDVETGRPHGTGPESVKSFRAPVEPQLVRPLDEVDEGRAEDNSEAARVLGKRAEDVRPEGVLVINFPGEEGYHCPVCTYPTITDGNYDERLAWSEYRTMLWCYVCERDYPSALCLSGDIDKAIAVYLSSVEQIVTVSGSTATPPSFAAVQDRVRDAIDALPDADRNPPELAYTATTAVMPLLAAHLGLARPEPPTVDEIAAALHEECLVPVDHVIGLECPSADNHRGQASRLRAALAGGEQQ